ncbi:mannose-1-phosphate guanyltransferase isoform X2 [Oncorhynchus kisutch]|uniref:mannose-1-phosphate guanyltransferase isoform X2 n=1 Tax=Oncorhynchus kisutch TaxID=8019 RepID=UPI0009A09A79|nr:mannose-1-phosphate guanyltransferase-like isoform X2 [Oncorhynchus kisutch]XP_031661430.1 mannose-1-phosphate guanyltransferase-like isoform X2 [Oncorhynchus kisutch]
MKAVILAAGYGTRLQRDVDNDTSGRFKHLAGIAKPLLPVGHCALISHWVQALNTTGCVDTVFVITNALHHKAFEEWALDFPNVKVLSDGTKSNEDRLGAVACLQLTVKHFKIEDHVIVIGGDTLFKEEFSLIKVKEKFSELQAMCEDSSLILSYQCKDEETQKYGILEVDEHLRVLCMKEKPLPSETKSRRACPCFYLFSKKILHLLDAFLDENKEAPIEEKDAPGNFLSWLISRKPVYIHQISGRFDVGNLPSYVECDRYFRENLQDVKSYMM